MKRRKKLIKPVISLRIHDDMYCEIVREAKQRKLNIAEEVRRRLQFYADLKIVQIVKPDTVDPFRIQTTINQENRK